MNINTITNIELSAICNNTCQYCPAPVQHKYRPVGYMDMDTFVKSINIVNQLQKQHTQRELNLFGIGEPTLNPLLIDMIKFARQNLPFRQILHLNTNGKTMTEKLAKQIKDAGINHVDITAHILQDTAKTAQIFDKINLPYNISFDPLQRPNNWAGQVDWYDCGIKTECIWLKYGQAMILWNGRITTCCIDSRAQGVVGCVDDDIFKLELKRFALCEKCNQNIGV